MALEVGGEFAGYRLLDVAGRGGMGVVYRAENLITRQIRALKVVAPEWSGDPRFLERFKRESRLAARLDHPNVIPLHEARQEEGHAYLVMSFVEGSDLSDELRQSGALHPERAVAVIGQVAAALDAAHSAGLVHRDVKPANVLLTTRNGAEHVYLTDFGLVKDVNSDSSFTTTGAFMGTYHYASPEQIDPSGGRGVDSRTDVYALGCVLYHTLAGEVPFPRDSLQAIMAAHLFLDPPTLSEVRPDLPQALDDVIRKAMAKDPAARHQSTGELADAARAALRQPTVRTAVGEGVATRSVRPDPRPRASGPPVPLRDRLIARWPPHADGAETQEMLGKTRAVVETYLQPSEEFVASTWGASTRFGGAPGKRWIVGVTDRRVLIISASPRWFNKGLKVEFDIDDVMLDEPRRMAASAVVPIRALDGRAFELLVWDERALFELGQGVAVAQAARDGAGA